MKAGVPGNFYACCRGGCDDVLSAGSREVEEKSHGIIGWTPGRVLSISEGVVQTFPELRDATARAAAAVARLRSDGEAQIRAR